MSKSKTKNKFKKFVARLATRASTAGAVSGVALRTAGFYKFPHWPSGLYMLASQLPGASGAGTVGIIGGTGGVIGTSAAILMSPLFIFTAGAVAVAGYGAYRLLTKDE